MQSPLELGQVFTREADFVLEGFLICSDGDCGSTFPILNGVPIVLKAIKGWWHSEKFKLSCAQSIASEIREYFEALDKAEAWSDAERGLLGSYMDLHYGSFFYAPPAHATWADHRQYWERVVRVARPETEAKYEHSLDLGCSVGRYTFELARLSHIAIGVDLSFNTVSSAAKFHRVKQVSYELRKHGRHFEEVQSPYLPPQNILFLVADALDPPFRAESFDLVAGLSLVDNVRLPLVLIGQMDALLRPGGSLILGSPYEWRADICDPEEWLETDAMDGQVMVRRILEGTMFPQMGLKYEVLQELLDLPWVLRHHARHWSCFLTHLIKAKKVGDDTA